MLIALEYCILHDVWAKLYWTGGVRHSEDSDQRVHVRQETSSDRLQDELSRKLCHTAMRQTDRQVWRDIALVVVNFVGTPSKERTQRVSEVFGEADVLKLLVAIEYGKHGSFGVFWDWWVDVALQQPDSSQYGHLMHFMDSLQG